MVNGVGNVLPFADPEQEDEDDVPGLPKRSYQPGGPTGTQGTAEPVTGGTQVTPTGDPVPPGEGHPSHRERREQPNNGSSSENRYNGMLFGGLPYDDDVMTTATPEFECRNYTKEEKKQIRVMIVERRPKPPVGRCSIPTVAGLKRKPPCDPEFDEDCEDDTPYSFCCTDGCEVVIRSDGQID